METNYKKQLLEEKINLNSKQPSKIKQNKEIYLKYKQHFSSIQELLYYYQYPEKAEQESKCKTCGKKTHFKVIKNKYNSYCSCSCANKNKELIKKRAETTLKHYGVSCVFKDTIKIKNSYLQKLGVTNPSKLDSVKNKVKNKMLSKIDQDGKNGYQQSAEKAKETLLLNIDENGLNGYQRKANKAKQTCLDKYGVSHYTKTKEYKSRYDNVSWVRELQEKRNQTMLINKTYAKSKQEDLVYNKLICLFGDNNIIRQYKSEKYPFKCDFYIKDKDLYIECNFFWTHGKYKEKILGVFDKNNIEHQKILKKWQDKTKTNPGYVDAINTWTKLDVAKYSTAQLNKLNYLMFYNLSQFDDWYNNYGNQT